MTKDMSEDEWKAIVQNEEKYHHHELVDSKFMSEKAWRILTSRSMVS